MEQRSRILLSLAVACVACADKPTSENVKRWASRREGPKLQKALRHPDATSDVRCDAAIALVAHGDVASVTTAAESIPAIGKDLRACLPKVLAGADADKHGHAATILTPLLEKAGQAARDEVAPAVGQWMAEDFSKRFQKALLVAVGPLGLAPLVDAQRAGLFTALTRKERESDKGRAMRNFAAAVSAVGNGATRATVAARIVGDFPKGAALPPAVLEALASLKAEGASELAKLLREQKADLLAMRRTIPAYLADQGDTTSIPKLIPVLQNSSEDIYVRGDIILYMNEVCTPVICREHAPILFKFLREEYPSSAAANTLLKIVGIDALERVLKEMVPTQVLSGGEVSKIVTQRIVPLGAKALPALVKALRGKNWIGRVLAIRALAKMGGAGEVAALMQLRGEKFRADVWRAETTIGQEAAAAVKEIQSRGARGREIK